jgi:hypothetical protein
MWQQNFVLPNLSNYDRQVKIKYKPFADADALGEENFERY